MVASSGQLYVHVLAEELALFEQIPEMAAEQVPGIIQVTWLTVMGELYGRVAVRLNGWENHKTEDEYQNHLIIKKFSFEFVQWFFGLFYTAFWTQNREELSGLLFNALVIKQVRPFTTET